MLIHVSLPVIGSSRPEPNNMKAMCKTHGSININYVRSVNISMHIVEHEYN
jgi:hypothetical protein